MYVIVNVVTRSGIYLLLRTDDAILSSYTDLFQILYCSIDICTYSGVFHNVIHF